MSVCPKCGTPSGVCTEEFCVGEERIRRTDAALERVKNQFPSIISDTFPSMEAVERMAARYGFVLVNENGRYGLTKFGKPFIRPDEGHDRKLLVRCAWFWASAEAWER